jgi:hypothetical protein
MAAAPGSAEGQRAALAEGSVDGLSSEGVDLARLNRDSDGAAVPDGTD